VRVKRLPKQRRVSQSGTGRLSWRSEWPRNLSEANPAAAADLAVSQAFVGCEFKACPGVFWFKNQALAATFSVIIVLERIRGDGGSTRSFTTITTGKMLVENRQVGWSYGTIMIKIAIFPEGT